MPVRAQAAWCSGAAAAEPATVCLSGQGLSALHVVGAFAGLRGEERATPT